MGVRDIVLAKNLLRANHCEGFPCMLVMVVTSDDVSMHHFPQTQAGRAGRATQPDHPGPGTCFGCKYASHPEPFVGLSLGSLPFY